jgi:hypothetical protein
MRVILVPFLLLMLVGCDSGTIGDTGAKDGGQTRTDGGGVPGDDDGDGVLDEDDNCPSVYNPDQLDWNSDGKGDPCDPQPPPETCGDQLARFDRAKPNILVILDRSLSMDEDDKWDQATAALSQMALNLADDLRLGLAVFSGLSGGGQQTCADPTLRLTMGEHTSAEVQASFAGVSPGGATPMTRALEVARTSGWVSDSADPSDATRKKNVLLVTDGQPNCLTPQDYRDEDPDGAVAAAGAFEAAGVPVYVVGFGNGVSPATLDLLAEAGGTDNPNDAAHRYYQANNGTDLEAALLAIGSAIVSCDLAVTDRPADPTRIYVLVNGTALVRDDANGFTYDSATNTVHLTGTACTALKDSAEPDLQVIFGCPPGGGPPIID